MKNYLLFFLFCCSSILLAQEANTQEKNSLYYSKLLEKAFEYTNKKMSNEAIKLGNEVLQYAKKEGDDITEAQAYNVIAIALLALKDNKSSLEHFIKVKDIYLRCDDSVKLATTYNNIGVTYAMNKDIDSSTVYYKKAMGIAMRTNNKKNMFLLSYNIGFNYGIHKEDYKNAMLYFNKALKFKDDPYVNKNAKGSLLSLIGLMKTHAKEYDVAHQYLDKGISIFKKQGYLETLQEAYGDKAKVYKYQKKLSLANLYLLKQVKVKDSLDNIEKEDLAKEIEAKYKQKDNKEKLQFIEKEKAVQKKLLAKSTLFNWLLVFFMVTLLYTAYWIYEKNKELKTARDKAYRYSKVKSDFYSEISHELRTPLYAVIELSGLLLKENVIIRHRRYLESLKFSGNHLLYLINNVLQLNKIEESGALKLECSVFNLKNVITTIIDSLEYALKDSGNTIALEFDDSIPRKLLGDSLKLSQVLVNLFSNAIKYSKKNLIEVTVTRINSEKHNGKVTVFFKVVDNDSAISKEKQLQVFDDYYHKHSKNENFYKNTGLGLSVVKNSLEVMNSSLEVGYEEDKRSSFYFTVQFEEKQEDGTEDSSYQKQLEIIAQYKLLVVDDNKINQLVTKKVLDQLSITSEVTDSGEKAIDLVKANHYDCVLMDLHMPNMDGYEATRQIRLFNKNISIIALTAATSEDIKKKIEIAKMNACILKPFITNDFVETIVRIVTKRDIN